MSIIVLAGIFLVAKTPLPVNWSPLVLHSWGVNATFWCICQNFEIRTALQRDALEKHPEIADNPNWRKREGKDVQRMLTVKDF